MYKNLFAQAHNSASHHTIVHTTITLGFCRQCTIYMGSCPLLVLQFSNVDIFQADISCRDQDSNLVRFGDLCHNNIASPAR